MKHTERYRDSLISHGSRLRPRPAQVAHLCVGAKLSVAEAARRLGISRSTAYAHFRSALYCLDVFEKAEAAARVAAQRAEADKRDAYRVEFQAEFKLAITTAARGARLRRRDQQLSEWDARLRDYFWATGRDP